MARDFLTDYRDLVRLTNPIDELQVVRRAADDQQIVFRQRHDGIPVYGAELGVYLRGRIVRGVIGRYRPGIAVASTPRISAAEAEALARIAIGGGATLDGDTQLRYLDRRVLGFSDAATYLTWMVNLARRGDHRTIFIDAGNGTVRYEHPRAATFDLDLEDGDLDTPETLCDVFENNNISANDRRPDSAMDYPLDDAPRHPHLISLHFRRADHFDVAPIELAVEPVERLLDAGADRIRTGELAVKQDALHLVDRIVGEVRLHPRPVVVDERLLESGRLSRT